MDIAHRTGRRLLPVLCLLCLPVLSSPAFAETGQQLTPAQDATLRVFAVGRVGIKTIHSEDGRESISIAVPESGHGTGFAVGDNGLVLTAQHVIAGATHVAVRLPGQQGFTAARVVVASAESDVAVLSIEADLPSLSLLDDNIPRPKGQTLYALGYPLDPTRPHALRSRGTMAGTRQDGMMQLDIQVRPGNSGGPVVDERHRAVGMIVAGDARRGVEGVGFATPLWKLKRALIEARMQVSAGRVQSLSTLEKHSAAVVDHLIQHGALRALDDREDLNTSIDREILERDLTAFARGIEDPDLLVFVAGNLWNAHLILRYGIVDTLNGKKLTGESLRALSQRFQDQSRALVRRAIGVDPKVAQRSSFVPFMMGEHRQETAQARSQAPGAASRQRDLFQHVLHRNAPATVGLWRANVYGFSDTKSVDLGVGAGLSGLLAHTIDQSDEARLRLLFGFSGTTGLGGQTREGAASNESVQTQTRIAIYAADLGLSYETSARKRHLSLEAAWTPAYVTTKETVTTSSPNMADAVATDRTGGSKPFHLRLALGVRHDHVDLWTSLRVLRLSGTTSAWLGLGVGMSL